jgi:hypothetical protein
MEGEPIYVDPCEGVMQTVVNEPGGAEYVPMQSHSLAHANRLLQREGRPMSQYIRRPSERRNTSVWYELAIRS